MPDVTGCEILVDAAARGFDADLDRALPGTAPFIRRWLGGSVVAFARNGLNAQGFPALALPMWLTTDAERTADRAFHVDVACSTLHGFCFIRLVDDVSDGDRPDDRRLILAACGVFQSRFQSAYHRYFHPDHPFWDVFAAAWSEQTEATCVDRRLKDVTAQAFAAVSSRKFSAAKIPVAATAFRHGRAHLIGPWCGLVDELGSLYQLLNDFLGWRLDHKYGINTYFLSEYHRRRSADEPIGAWFRRDGRAWGSAMIDDTVSHLFQTAAALGSDTLSAWLETCRSMVQDQLTTCEQLARWTPDHLPGRSASAHTARETSGQRS